jgi:hypothetical protein
MNKKKENDYIDEIHYLKCTNTEVLGDYNFICNELRNLKKEFAIFKIMTHLINNGMEQDMAKIMAVDSYTMTMEVQI